MGAWKRLDAPQARGAGIVSIDCRSGTCVGVGGQLDATYAARLAVRGWRKLSTRTVANGHSSLSGVSCTAPQACVAVGTSKANQVGGDAPNTYAPVIELQSRSWTVVRVRLPDDRYYFLQSLSCTRSQYCVAVGYVQQPSAEASGDAEPLIISNR